MEERRAAAIADISGAILKTWYTRRWQGYNYFFKREIVNLLIKTDPTYTQYFPTNKAGKIVIYARLNTAIYGYLRAAILFYYNLAG